MWRGDLPNAARLYETALSLLHDDDEQCDLSALRALSSVGHPCTASATQSASGPTAAQPAGNALDLMPRVGQAVRGRHGAVAASRPSPPSTNARVAASSAGPQGVELLTLDELPPSVERRTISTASLPSPEPHPKRSSLAGAEGAAETPSGRASRGASGSSTRHSTLRGRAALGAGVCHLQLRELEAARARLSEAVALRPRCGRTLYNRGVLHMIAERWEEAERDLRHCLKRMPLNAEAWMRKSVAIGQQASIVESGRKRQLLVDYANALLILDHHELQRHDLEEISSAQEKKERTRRREEGITLYPKLDMARTFFAEAGAYS